MDVDAVQNVSGRQIENLEVLLVESNLSRQPSSLHQYCFGCPYNFLTVSDDQTTANMDPCKI